MKSLEDFPHWAIKLVGTSILLILSMLFGMMPMMLAQNATAPSPLRRLLISLSNCFAGGVFFSTVILDLFPMVKVKMHQALIYAEIETEFPMGDFLVGVGFLMMLVLEQVIHSCCKNAIISHDGHVHKVAHTDHEGHIIDSDDDDHYGENDKLLNGGEWHTPVPKERKHKVSVRSVPDENDDNDDGDDDNDFERSTKSVDTNDTYFSSTGSRILRRHRSKSLASVETIIQSNFRTYVLVFAISLHSIFEGLAIGLIVKSNQLIQIYIALLIHKSIIAFSIGVQLVDAEMPKMVIIICLIIFSSMAPIGVGLGLGVLNSFDTGIKLFFSGILQAIATGTFLYVTFFEVLPHELNIEDDKKMLKIIFVIIGYALVTAICTYENKFHKFKKVKPDNSTVLVGIDI